MVERFMGVNSLQDSRNELQRQGVRQSKGGVLETNTVELVKYSMARWRGVTEDR